MMTFFNATAQEAKEITTASGLKYKIIQQGKGVKPEQGDRVSVHYVGTLPDGTKFDSSRDRGQPYTFTIGQGQVIKGWDEGIALLHVGDKAILTIPPDLGYGAQAAGKIPANSTLIFEVELMEVKAKIAVKAYDVAGKDTIALQDGLKMIIVKNGTGPKPENGKTVSVHYTGYLANGTKFDSSVERGEPIAFPLGQGRVIKGWDMGIAALNVGTQARLLIPYTLGYGDNGYPPIIPAKSDLVFDVELVGIQ
jgi:peptidylprolyl isomerase